MLIIASENDIHAISVAAEIEKQSTVQPLIIDSAGFPYKWNLTLRFRSSGLPSFSLNIGSLELHDTNLCGVWHRRIKKHHIPELDNEKLRFAYAESRALFESWTYCLGDKLINPRHAQVAANHKGWQLNCAAKVGLQVPNTAMTNFPSELFLLKKQVSRVVFKPFTPTSSPFMVTTTAYQKDYDSELDRLRFAPVIFQEQIDKIADIRVTIIDSEVFPIEIRPSQPAGQLDWRIDKTADMRTHHLPETTRNSLLKLMSMLNLRYGAIDLALTKDNKYIFFEVNPAGQFLFAQIHAGVNICAGMARALTKFS